MNQSPEIDQLATALAAFQGEVEAIPKTDTNPYFKSKYAGLPDVIRVASPVAAKHGLSVTQMLDSDPFDRVDTLTTVLMHKSGQWVSSTTRMHLVKEDPQGHGSAVTYMRRYAYMAALGLVADEDDDGNAASPQKTVRGHQYQETKKRPPPQVVDITPKARLLRECGGNVELATRLWTEHNFEKNPPSSEELLLLLTQARTEVGRAQPRD